LHKSQHFALDLVLDRGMHTTLGPYQARKPRVKPMLKNGFSIGATQSYSTLQPSLVLLSSLYRMAKGRHSENQKRHLVAVRKCLRTGKQSHQVAACTNEPLCSKSEIRNPLLAIVLLERRSSGRLLPLRLESVEDRGHRGLVPPS
jgi:hypothetical protein